MPDYRGAGASTSPATPPRHRRLPDPRSRAAVHHPLLRRSHLPAGRDQPGRSRRLRPRLRSAGRAARALRATAHSTTMPTATASRSRPTASSPSPSPSSPPATAPRPSPPITRRCVRRSPPTSPGTWCPTPAISSPRRTLTISVACSSNSTPHPEPNSRVRRTIDTPKALLRDALKVTPAVKRVRGRTAPCERRTRLVMGELKTAHSCTGSSLSASGLASATGTCTSYGHSGAS